MLCVLFVVKLIMLLVLVSLLIANQIYFSGHIVVVTGLHMVPHSASSPLCQSEEQVRDLQSEN